VSWRGIKRDALDKVFSDYIRERDGWTCQYCKLRCHNHEPRRLDCSHFHSRRHYATRWDPDNADAMCMTCHERLGGSPGEYTDWKARQLGAQKYQRLRVRAAQVGKRPTKFERAVMTENFRTWISELRALEKSGVRKHGKYS